MAENLTVAWHGTDDATADPRNMENAPSNGSMFMACLFGLASSARSTDIHDVSGPLKPTIMRSRQSRYRAWATEDHSRWPTLSNAAETLASFHFDVGISLSHHIVRFWGLADEYVAARGQIASFAAGIAKAKARLEYTGMQHTRAACLTRSNIASPLRLDQAVRDVAAARADIAAAEANYAAAQSRADSGAAHHRQRTSSGGGGHARGPRAAARQDDNAGAGGRHCHRETAFEPGMTVWVSR
jgi:hypothetical protein